MEDARKPSASFDRNGAPSRAPIGDNVNFDQLAYGQLNELCKQRGFHKKDAKAAPEALLEAMGAAGKKTTGGSSNDMDTSMTALGKRSRNEEGAMETEPRVEGNIER